MSDRTWVFAARQIVITYQDETRGGVVFSHIVSQRPRDPSDPPYVTRPGTWVAQGKVWIFTPREDSHV